MVVEDQECTRECYIATLKDTIQHLEYELSEIAKSNKRQAQKKLQVNVILVFKLDNRDSKNPRLEYKSYHKKYPWLMISLGECKLVQTWNQPFMKH